MKKALFGVFVALCMIIGTLAYVKYEQINTLINAGKSFAPPAITTTSFIVKEATWEQTLSTIGSLEASKGLVITADISGRISKVLFKAGSEVKAGDLLVEQDTSEERAQRRSNQAAEVLAKSNLKRTAELYSKRVASKSELDNAQSSYDSAVADVDNTRAIIEKKSIRTIIKSNYG